MTPNKSQYELMVDYVRRVRALLHSTRNIFTESELAECEHLIDHDEPAEGLRALAWIIVEEKKKVPAETITGIRALTEGLIEEEHMPPDLDSYVLAEAHGDAKKEK